MTNSDSSLSHAKDYARYSAALEAVRKPAAFIDLEKFDENTVALVRRANGVPIRLASKSVRCLALIQRALRNPGFSGVLAYRAWEAVYLAENGIDDIVVAYPTVSESEILSVISSVRSGKRITLMTDRIEHLELLGRLAEREKATLPVCIDLDMSSRFPGLYFGVRRSWISSAVRLERFLEVLKKFPDLKLDGAMGYEAQIAGVADSGLFFRFLKSISTKRVRRARADRVAQIRAAGYSLRFVNGGGTGSVESTGLDSAVTEIAAGSGLYSPTLFDGYDSFRAKSALGFALEVVRKPEESIATCFSGGFIASGSIGKEKLPTPYLPEGLRLLAHEGAGEVQTPVEGEAALALEIGDLVFFRPAKAGEALERFNEIYLISGDKIIGTERTYRGDGKNFG